MYLDFSLNLNHSLKFVLFVIPTLLCMRSSVFIRLRFWGDKVIPSFFHEFRFWGQGAAKQFVGRRILRISWKDFDPTPTFKPLPSSISPQGYKLAGLRLLTPFPVNASISKLPNLPKKTRTPSPAALRLHRILWYPGVFWKVYRWPFESLSFPRK